MAFQIKWTEETAAQYSKIRSAASEATTNRLKAKKKKSSQREGLLKQVAKTIKHLGENPRHPGLVTHEYSDLENPYDKKQKVWEAYVQNNTPGAYRVFWCYGPRRGWVTIISITPHP
jgi:hypothetical protein